MAPTDRLVQPSKIIGVGLNYRDHAVEAAMELPERPLLFAKWPSSIIGPGEPILLPLGADEVDYEGELAVVIGTRIANVPPEHALPAIAFYTCLNDVSARDVQLSEGQWTRGKSFDTFCPVGPRLVPADEVGDPQSLNIRCYLNGNTVQDATTADMVFSIGEIVSFASRATTLEPGDVIATGTPPGVALGRPDRRYLRAGDVIEVEIERIGVLRNPVASAPANVLSVA